MIKANSRMALISSLLSILFLQAAAGLISPADGAGPLEIECGTQIVEASVYRGGEVRVFREGSVEVEPGLFVFVCGGFPFRINQSSVRVEGSGTAEAGITGVDIRTEEKEVSTPEEYTRLTGRLEILKSRKDSLSIRRASLNKRLEFVTSLSDFTMEKANGELAEWSFNVGDWRAVLDFIENESNGARSRISAAERMIAKTDEEIRAVNEKLRMIRMDEKSREVRINCEVETAGRLDFRVSYLVGEAGWNPEYIISYDSSKETVELAYRAHIVQRTGEEWKDVSVTLSTARPRLGAGPPELRPSYLKKWQRRRMPPGAVTPEGERFDEALHLKGGAAEREKMLDAEGAPESLKIVPMREAESSRSGFSANFKVRSPVTISSGAGRRVLIRKGKLPVDLSLYSAPRVSQHVFASGRLTNSMDVPILAGTAGVYIIEPEEGSYPSSTFVGESRINDLPPGGKADFHLGIDQDVKVEHELENREYLSEEGDREKEIRYHYLMTVENFKERSVELTLKDRVPVSAMDDIEVDDVDISPDPEEAGENGIAVWNLTMEPGEKIDIRVQYTVRFPGDWPEYSILNLE
jgi:uncharacterized protein (TIGR02231 family)